MLAEAEAVFDAIGPYLCMTREKFEHWFTAELDRDTEAVAWMKITLAWLEYHEQFLNDERQPDDEERKLLSGLILIASGVHDATKLRVPAQIGRRLLRCYELFAKA